MKHPNKGFTLIELVIVIIVLGILAATAIPKFINIQDDANRAAIRAHFAAFDSAVKLYHSGWLTQGQSGAVENLKGFGDGDVDSSPTGYPYATSGLAAPAGSPVSAASVETFTACEELWYGLSDTTMTIAYVQDEDLATTDAEIAYTYRTNECIYRATHFMQKGQSTLTMNYNFITGVTEIVNAGYSKP